MKPTKKTILCYIILCVSFTIKAQHSNIVEKGNTLFEKYAYDDAIKIYLKAIDKQERSSDLYANLADSYYENADMENAAIWYEALMNYDLPSVKGEYYFRYSQALKASGNYKKADEWLTRLAELNADDSRATSLKYDIDYLKDIEKQSGRYETESVAINTPYSDFAANLGDAEVIFSSSRDKGVSIKRSHTWTGLPFLELFSAEVLEDGNLTNAQKLKGDFNSRYNESTAIITNDGNTMYYTRNSYKDGYEKDKTGTVRLKLYKATKIDGVWKNSIELPFNNTEYSVAHPALSQDNKKLYFASDMPGGIGLSDIYVVDIHEDGTYGEPQNLGRKVNTEGRDTFPFISKKGHLYFSSDGHLGLGGLDVFVSLNPKDPDYPKTDKVFNVGKPINSEFDDFAFTINDDTKLGYFTSNRNGGLGSDDIYRLEELRPLDIDIKTAVIGKIINKKTGEPIPNTTITVYDSNFNKLYDLTSGADGSYTFDLIYKKPQNYRITAKKRKFIGNEDTFSVHPKTGTELAVNLEIEPILGSDLFKALNLDKIYFDYNEVKIRPDAATELDKIIVFLIDNPTVKIDVRSHTDSRGSEKFNLRLSEKRNASTIEYIVKNGNIAQERVTGKGYGESQLINKCTDKIDCTEEEHDVNRRSEFIVIEN